MGAIALSRYVSFPDAGPSRPQPRALGPASGTLQGRNPREGGHPIVPQVLWGLWTLGRGRRGWATSSRGRAMTAVAAGGRPRRSRGTFRTPAAGECGWGRRAGVRKPSHKASNRCAAQFLQQHPQTDEGTVPTTKPPQSDCRSGAIRRSLRRRGLGAIMFRYGCRFSS